ncbi:helix-turn-helix transcriptional regulator [Streptomyces spectabilis]|uniref:helix-turn-helix domain-containing protein n=1 Tax=Streptomyces spectabilis TaxID=68270 RepID=UPI0034059D50
MNSHQHHPGEPDHPAEDHARQGEDLAALLERLLDEAPDKTQKDLAAAANISYPTLNSWMNRTRGTSRVSPDRLRALAEAFRKWKVDVTVAEVFAAAGRQVPGRSEEEREARLLKLYRQLPEDKQRDVVKYAEAMLAVSRVS